MHRLIVTSSTYQQSMKHPRAEEFETLDPRNRYLWVRDPLRLEAEVIRDSLLAVSGQLRPENGGPPFFPAVDDAILRRAPTWWEPSPLEERNRRTIYMLQYRSLQLPFLKAFNGASLNESCSVREVTTVTPQVFALFNSKFVLRQSQAMADRIRDETGGEPGRQVERAFQLALQRSPSDRERASCLGFLGESSPSVRIPASAAGVENNNADETSAAPADDASEDLLVNLCLVLLNSNEFVFLE
jgi:hypothetical protein